MGADRSRDVVVVGAGHNGLVAAAYLAEAGLDVEVVERLPRVGGACATEELFPGYLVSAYSYVCWLLQPKVIRELGLERFGFQYRALDPVTFSPFEDGDHTVYWQDTSRTVHELSRLNSADARSYPAWEEFWKRAAGILYPFFLAPPPSLDRVWAHARELGETGLLERLLTVPLATIAAEFFDDTRIQASAVSVNEIGDPWKPGSAWTETYFHLNSASGFGYAVALGGMGAIAEAIRASAESRGVTVTTGVEVEEILVDGGGAAVGVRTVDGAVVTAATVVSNADPKRTLLRLLPDGALSLEWRRRIESLSTATSYLKFHSVMSRLPDLSGYGPSGFGDRHAGYIKIAPSLEHFRTAHRQVLSGQPVEEPIVHVQVPTVYDSTLTSKPGHIVSIWSQFAPPRLTTGSWDERRDEVGEALIEYVTRFVPNFRRDMVEWQLFTPADLEARVGLTDGNIRHLDTVPDQFLGQRPLQGSGYRTPIEGLYMCGAGTHPGGEVTGAPGHNAAAEILRDERAGAGSWRDRGG